MLFYNFKYELKLLLRSRWIQLLSIILLVLFGFSAYNGLKKMEKRQNDIATAIQEVATTDKDMLQQLDSIEQGMAVNASRWTMPTSPMAIGNYHPRVAAMEPSAMAFLAIGQADLYEHTVKPTVSGDDHALSFSAMTSPVQLLFGSFDLAFVIVYLLPLIIIAFSYNVLAAEKENGSLRILASQPISIPKWVMQKLGFRFFCFAIVTVLALILVFLGLGINPFINSYSFGLLLGLICSYSLFWFALSFLINLWVGSSAKNALSLLGLWVVFVLLAPAVLNQLGDQIYPMPSRSLMINKMRTTKANVTKKQDQILDNFLRDHPEYAINDSTKTRNFYHKYMASQQLISETLSPLVNAYQKQLKSQQQWINKFNYISPSIIAQENLNKLAGSATIDYENYRDQVISFAAQWRNHFIPMLYNNQNFSTSDYAKLPSFNYKPAAAPSLSNCLFILVVALSLFGIGFFSTNKTSFTV